MKKLNLGKELTKNDQKKVLGGVEFVCVFEVPPYDILYNLSYMSCSTAAAYCEGQQGELAVCYG